MSTYGFLVLMKGKIMDQELKAAQARLEEKRKAMGQTTLSTPNIETCKHGIPMHIKCRFCEEDAEIAALPEDHPKCKHDRPEGYCHDCKYEEETLARERKRNEDEEERRQYIYHHPEDQLRRCYVPKKYLKCSFDNFSGNDKLVKDCREHEGNVVLQGNTGSGKTHLAVSILRERVRNMKHEGALFETAPELLLSLRSTFDSNSLETEENVIDRYSGAPFLILDDLGSEKATEFSITSLYIIIDRRDRELLPTIITTNMSLKEIEDHLSARIASRLAGMKVIKINMPDYRKKR